MCTFWHTSSSDNWENLSSSSSSSSSDDHKQDDKQTKAANKLSGSSLADGLLWNLFICKNFLLVVFGILGLITGSWISISELGASYMGIADAVE